MMRDFISNIRATPELPNSKMRCQTPMTLFLWTPIDMILFYFIQQKNLFLYLWSSIQIINIIIFIILENERSFFT